MSFCYRSYDHPLNVVLVYVHYAPQLFFCLVCFPVIVLVPLAMLLAVGYGFAAISKNPSARTVYAEVAFPVLVVAVVAVVFISPQLVHGAIELAAAQLQAIVDSNTMSGPEPHMFHVRYWGVDWVFRQYADFRGFFTFQHHCYTEHGIDPADFRCLSRERMRGLLYDLKNHSEPALAELQKAHWLHVNKLISYPPYMPK